MDSTRDLNAMKRTQHILDMRLMELRRLESKAHRGWTESKGAPGMLEQWTEAITRSQETASAIYYLDRIVNEIESK